MDSNTLASARLEQVLGFILAGSGLGTLFFYGLLYIFAVHKKRG
jgi:hypothetical protein